MEVQLVGTIDGPHGPAEAMLSVDTDRPLEFILQGHGNGILARGVLADGSWEGETLNLIPRWGVPRQ
jgi:hypothetical protein